MAFLQDLFRSRHAGGGRREGAEEGVPAAEVSEQPSGGHAVISVRATGAGTAARYLPAAAPVQRPVGKVALSLDDVLAHVPTRALKPGLHDPAQALLFETEELLDGISKGRATIPLSRLAARYPETFQQPAADAEDPLIPLPLQKLMQQIGEGPRTSSPVSQPKPELAWRDEEQPATPPEIGSIIQPIKRASAKLHRKLEVFPSPPVETPPASGVHGAAPEPPATAAPFLQEAPVEPTTPGPEGPAVDPEHEAFSLIARQFDQLAPPLEVQEEAKIALTAGRPGARNDGAATSTDEVPKAPAMPPVLAPAEALASPAAVDSAELLWVPGLPEEAPLSLLSAPVPPISRIFARAPHPPAPIPLTADLRMPKAPGIRWRGLQPPSERESQPSASAPEIVAPPEPIGTPEVTALRDPAIPPTPPPAVLAFALPISTEPEPPPSEVSVKQVKADDPVALPRETEQAALAPVEAPAPPALVTDQPAVEPKQPEPPSVERLEEPVATAPREELPASVPEEELLARQPPPVEPSLMRTKYEPFQQEPAMYTRHQPPPLPVQSKPEERPTAPTVESRVIAPESVLETEPPAGASSPAGAVDAPAVSSSSSSSMLPPLAESSPPPDEEPREQVAGAPSAAPEPMLRFAPGRVTVRPPSLQGPSGLLAPEETAASVEEAFVFAPRVPLTPNEAPVAAPPVAKTTAADDGKEGSLGMEEPDSGLADDAAPELGGGSSPEHQISNPSSAEDLLGVHFSLARINQEPLQAIFMTEEFLDLPRISQLSCGFPGVTGCMIVAGDALAHGGEQPAGLDAPGLCQLTRQLAAAAEAFPEELPSVQTYTLHTGHRALSIFAREHLSLCVVHSHRGFLPGVRERLAAVADTLSRGLAGEAEPG